MFVRLAYIAIENYAIVRERFGQYSLEIIIAITYVLNILKMGKTLEKENKSVTSKEEIEKIRKTLDVKKIQKSITILSERNQQIFRNAIEQVL